MKESFSRRILLSVFAAAAALFVAGCNSNQTIAPNWYDSAFYKDGALVNGAPPNTAATAEPGSH